VLTLSEVVAVLTLPEVVGGAVTVSGGGAQIMTLSELHSCLFFVGEHRIIPTAEVVAVLTFSEVVGGADPF
jgi:hypothetical protein